MQVEPQSGVPEIPVLAEWRAWRSFAAVAGVLALVALVYWPTSASLAATWARSETFTHGFLVVPAALWFVWKSRARLAATEAKVWWPGLVALGAAGFIWLAGNLAGALAPTQWAIVLMVPLTVLTLFGWGWLRVLAFPMAFLFFAVPLGEALVPTLIDWTADFTVAALAASGIPVYREDTFFVIPSGRWSVVQGCSGVRYLIASLMVGVLYARIMYRSPVRRTLFVIVSILLPLVANWLRAYMIVMIGHLTDNRLAAGVDHLLYGWVFFGVVIALMFLIGARWRDDHQAAPLQDVMADVAMTDSAVLKTRLMPSIPALTVATVVIGMWPAFYDVQVAAGDKRPVQPVPVVAAMGWTGTSMTVADWKPALEGPVRTQIESFSRGDSTVTAFIGYYRDQRQGSELVSSMNRLTPDGGEQWEQIDRMFVGADFGAGVTTVSAATLRHGGQRLRVWHWYWIDGQVRMGDTFAKLSLARDRLLGRTDTSAWVAIFTTAESDAAADRILAAFTRDMGPALQSALAATAAH